MTEINVKMFLFNGCEFVICHMYPFKMDRGIVTHMNLTIDIFFKVMITKYRKPIPKCISFKRSNTACKVVQILHNKKGGT